MPEVIKTNYFIYSGLTVDIPDTEDFIEIEEETLPYEKEEIFTEIRESIQPVVRPEPEIRTVIKEVYRDPEPLTREDIERIYKDEISEICTEAEKKAYDDALAAKEAEIEACIAEVQALIGEVRSEKEQYMEDYARELKYFAIEIAEKMILEKIGEDDLILNKMVLQAVTEVRNSEWLRVEVSDRLTGLTEFLKDELAKPEYRGQAAVSPVAAAPDTCRVVTDSGAIVATVSVQAENLRRIFSEADSPEQ